jgi:hypothetical protein
VSRRLPPLRRDIDLIPVTRQDQEMLLVRDPLGLVPEGMALRPESYGLLSLLHSPREAGEVAAELTRLAGGRMISSEDVESVAEQLETAWLLESERFREAREGIRREYAELEVRECFLAGGAYPLDPEELQARLDAILSLADGRPPPSGRLVGLAAPHIDLAAGERVYARAYRSLDQAPPDRVVVLGVGHHMGDGLFSLTDKDFATPLGTLRNDREASSLLREAAGPLAAPGDFEHKAEHSVEFQALFLKRVLGEAAPPAAPVLCGSASLMLPELSRAAFLDAAGPFLEALAGLAADPDRRTLMIAGVDLCHIGPKFGHQHTASELEAQASRHDARLLERVAARDPDGFWEEAARVQDGYHVCGLTALACLLEALPPDCRRGEVLDYEMWREAPTRSAVSFAACSFRVPEGA